MSQQSNPSQTQEESDDWAYTIESCQAEVRANSLIDKLFQEFEQNLEPPYPLSVEWLPTPPEATTAWLSPSSQKTDQEDLWVSYAPYRGQPFSPTTAPGTASSPTSAASDRSSSWLQHPQSHPFSDRLLLGVACASMLVTVGLWAASQFGSQSAPVPVAVAPTVNIINPADAKFAQYMERALEIISQQSPPAPSPATSSAIASALPPGTIPPATVAGQSTNGVERIYIPVYQPQTPQTTIPRNLPAPTSMAAVAPAVKPLAPALPKYTLQGVLELGDRSVALVNMNGVTQRVALGQPLGASGWQLIQVANQNAVVQKKGEVRSITVGQQF